MKMNLTIECSNLDELRSLTKALSGHANTPSINENDTPSINENDTPSINENDTPSINENDTPSINENDTPSINENDTPSINENDTPSINENDTPSINENDTPSINENDTPSINENDTPSINENDTPSINENDTPSINENDTPSINENDTLTVAKNDTLTVDLDTDGMPHCADYHAMPPQTSKDGTWRAKRGKAEDAKVARAIFKAGGGTVEQPSVQTTASAAVGKSDIPPSLPGAENIPTAQPVSLEQVIERATALLDSQALDNNGMTAIYLEITGKADNQQAFAVFQTNESARAALIAKFDEIENG